MSASAYSIVLPCHNEADHIGGLLRDMARAFDGTDYEILVVADGCTDGTEEAVRDAMATVPRVRLLENPRRLGKGGAIRRGILEARGRSVGFMDGDGEIDPRFLRDAFSALEREKTDMVVGNRYGAGGAYHTTLMRHVTSRVYQLVIWLLFGLHVHDTQAGLKVFTADVAKNLFTASDIDGYAFDIDVLTHAHWMGYRMAEIPMHQRFKGTSTIAFRHVLEMVADTCGTYDRHVRDLLSGSEKRARAGLPTILWSCLLYPFTKITEILLGTVLRATK